LTAADSARKPSAIAVRASEKIGSDGPDEAGTGTVGKVAVLTAPYLDPEQAAPAIERGTSARAVITTDRRA